MSFFKQPLSKQVNILNYCPEPICIVTESGAVTYANNAAFELFEDSNLLSQNIKNYFLADKSLIIEPTKEKQVLSFVSGENNKKTTEIKIEKLPDEDKFLISLNDITKCDSLITELVSQKEEEAKVNINKSQFLYKISNNLKSPLHSIIGFSQAILEGLGGEINEKQEKYLKIIHKNSSELLLLLEKVLDLSQIEANLYEYKSKNFDVVNIANIAINEIKPRIDEKRLSITLDTEELNKKACVTDEQVFKTILSNLLENALISCDIGGINVKLSNPSVEYLGEKGIFLPENADTNAFLMIQVKDSGSGVPSSELKDIFNPYIQVDKNAKKHLLKGLILGITKEFVKQLKGIIWVESEVMKESVYSVIIPVDKLQGDMNNENQPQLVIEEKEENNDTQAEISEVVLEEETDG